MRQLFTGVLESGACSAQTAKIEIYDSCIMWGGVLPAWCVGNPRAKAARPGLFFSLYEIFVAICGRYSLRVRSARGAFLGGFRIELYPAFALSVTWRGIAYRCRA